MIFIKGLPGQGYLAIDLDGTDEDKTLDTGSGGVTRQLLCQYDVGSAKCGQRILRRVAHDVDPRRQVDHAGMAGHERHCIFVTLNAHQASTRALPATARNPRDGTAIGSQAPDQRPPDEAVGASHQHRAGR